MLSITTGDPNSFTQRMHGTEDGGKKQLETPIYGGTHTLAF
jgi:hypothetical protein